MKNVKTFITIAAIACVSLVGNAEVQEGKMYSLRLNSDETKSVMIKDSEMMRNKTAVLWTDVNSPSQRWELKKDTEGMVQIINLNSGMALFQNTASSASVVQREVKDTDSFKWALVPVTGEQDCYTVEHQGLAIVIEEDGSLKAKAVADDAKAKFHFVEEPDAVITHSQEVRDVMLNGFLTQYLRARTADSATLGGGGGWSDAEMLEVLLDAYEVSESESALDAFKKVYKYFYDHTGATWDRLIYTDAYKWYGHEFNDDVMWMIIAAARAGILLDDNAYTQASKTNFDIIYGRGLNQWGMMRWKENDPGCVNGTNSCINSPTVIAACLLASSLNDEEYYEKAKALFDKEIEYLFNAETGEVYDNMTWTEEGPKSPDKSIYTYNQGTFIGAASLLFEHYGDTKYRDVAAKAVEYSMSTKKICDNYGIIKVCQGPTGDGCGFKGILMRWMRRYIKATEDIVPIDWMKANAMRAFANRNSKDVATTGWLTKTPEDFVVNGTNISNLAFGPSTAVSAAFNAPLSVEEILGHSAVSEVKGATIVRNGIYTLQGVKVPEGASLSRGIYVINGQKRLVK